MTKLEIINNVSDKTGLQKNKAEEAVELVIEEIKNTLASGESIILRRFGTFSVTDKKKRVGRNPKTGKEAEISARRVVRFRVGKHFKEAVNQS